MRKYRKYSRFRKGADFGFAVEEQPRVSKRRGFGFEERASERPKLYYYPDMDMDLMKFLRSSDQWPADETESDDGGDGNVVGEIGDADYGQFLDHLTPHGTSYFLTAPNETLNEMWASILYEAVEDGGNGARSSNGDGDGLCGRRQERIVTKETKGSSAYVVKNKEKWEDPLKKIRASKYDSVCRTNGDDGLFGGSEVRVAGRIGRNLAENVSREVAEEDADGLRSIPTREIKGSFGKTWTRMERKDSVGKAKEKCEALDPASGKNLHDKVLDVAAESIGSARERYEAGDGKNGARIGDRGLYQAEEGLCGVSKVRSVTKETKGSMVKAKIQALNRDEGKQKLGTDELCGESKARVAEKMGKNFSIPTREIKGSSVKTKIQMERKGSVAKEKEKCEAASNPVSGSKKIADKLQDDVEIIGSAKARYDPFAVKQEYPVSTGSDSDDVIELDPSMLPCGDATPFLHCKPLEAIDEYNHAVMDKSSKFRVKLMEILRQPYSNQEYKELLNEVSRPRQKQDDEETSQPSTAKRPCAPGLSYLDQNKDFAKKLNEARIDPEGSHNRRERLNLLRGFVYWLQHLLMYGSFKPWTDQTCLQELPR